MSSGFPPEIVAAVLYRDLDRCPICGHRAETANHRANRGNGGSKLLNAIWNAVAICHVCNGLIESDPVYADLARQRGVKVARGIDPRTVPYLHPFGWVLLTDRGLEQTDAPESEGAVL